MDWFGAQSYTAASIAFEFMGYVAGILVFSTFYMKTMLPLRIIAITSNLAFITYAILGHLLPGLILHAALLPLNLLRLFQIRKLLYYQSPSFGFHVFQLVIDRLLIDLSRNTALSNTPENR